MGRDLYLDGYSKNRSSSKKRDRVGIPKKGRNAGKALREELDDKQAEDIIGLLNGKGKEAAKTGANFTDIWKEVKKRNDLKLKDAGRKFPRPVFTNLITSEKKLFGYNDTPLDSNFDCFYQGIDRVVEENFTSDEISRDFKNLAEEVVGSNLYSLEQSYGK